VLHALLKRKLRVAEPSIEYRDVEDHLTAAVLERISYLSPKLAADMLEASVVEDRFGQVIASDVEEDVDDVWIDFWPRFADPTSSQSIVEPDAILGVGSRVYVIEAKRTDERGQSAEQAARDWLSYYFEEDEEGDGLENDACTLLLLGGIADAGKFADLSDAIKQHIVEADTPIVPRVAWISWTKLASKVRDFIQDALPQDMRILEDINLALTHHGFGAWITFEQLAQVVDARPIRLGADALPIDWPNFPNLSPRKPATPPPHPFDDWRRFASTVKISATPSQFPVYSQQAKQWK
jgi:hypothetical protein